MSWHCSRADQQRTFLRAQIDRATICSSVRKLSGLIGQLSDLVEIQLQGAEEAFRILRRFINFGPFKIICLASGGSRYLDFQLCDSSLKHTAATCGSDDNYVKVFTLKELPGETRPLLLQELVRDRHQFSCCDRMESHRQRAGAEGNRPPAAGITTTQRRAFSSNLEEKKSQGPQDELVDDSKQAAVEELGECLKAIGNDGKYFGEFSSRWSCTTKTRGRSRKQSRNSRRSSPATMGFSTKSDTTC